jgi:hypothetical protein
MAGSGIPRYDNNGRHGSCYTTRLARAMEHDHITGPHDNPKLPSIVSHLAPEKMCTDRVVLDTPHRPLRIYRHRQLYM